MKKKFIILATLFVVLILCPICFAEDRIVPDSYQTIGAAMSAASSGDIIVVKAGTYSEMVDFTKSNITLTRNDDDEVTITGGSNSRVIRFLSGSDGSKIEHVNVFGSSSVQYLIAFQGNVNNITIANCNIKGGAGTEKWVYAGIGGNNNLTIENNKFSGRATYDGPFFIGSSDNFAFTDNEISGDDLASGTGTIFFVEWMNEEAGSNYCNVERNYWYNLGSQLSVSAFMFREVDGFYFRNNVVIIDSDYSGGYGAIAQIRGMTDGGDSCDNFYFTNNTIVSAKSFHQAFFILSDTPVNVKITNNLIIGTACNVFENLSPLNTGSGNLIENNRITDSDVNWAAGLGNDWTVRNNTVGQSVVWNNTGEKPYPFYTLTESLNGVTYNWTPSNDFLNNLRLVPQDVGAFEYNSGGGPPTAPSFFNTVTIY